MVDTGERRHNWLQNSYPWSSWKRSECFECHRFPFEVGILHYNMYLFNSSNIHAKITKFWYGTDGGGGVDAEQQQHNNSISISTSFSEKVEGIPITPKIAQDLIFFTPSSKIQQQQQQQQFSPTQVSVFAIFNVQIYLDRGFPKFDESEYFSTISPLSHTTLACHEHRYKENQACCKFELFSCRATVVLAPGWARWRSGRKWANWSPKEIHIKR